jgi:hypothetical protein
MCARQYVSPVYLTVSHVSIRKSDALCIKTDLHLVWFSYTRNMVYEAYTFESY